MYRRLDGGRDSRAALEPLPIAPDVRTRCTESIRIRDRTCRGSLRAQTVEWEGA